MKKFGKLMVVAAATCAMIMPQAVYAASFTDVPSDQYYSGPVDWAVQEGIASGNSDNTFRPNDKCTRAQIVTFLYNAYGNDEEAPEASFSDVSSDAYYASAVNWAVAKGVTTGIGEGTFGPNVLCTRAQAVTFLYNAAGDKAVSGSASKFSDVSSGSYYYDAVGWAVDKGVTTGTSATAFSPSDKCSRGQIVTFLYNAMKGTESTNNTGAESASENSSEKETAKPEATPEAETSSSASTEAYYVGNADTKIFHRPDCSSVKTMKEENKVTLSTRDEAINEGYRPCKNCKP